MNKVIIRGNLTRDPELRYTPSGVPLCEFGMAGNRKYKGKDGEQHDDTLFIDVTAWGKTSEVIAKYLTKGSPIFVEGRLNQDTWTDKQTGQKRSKHTVVCENFQFIGGRGDSAAKEGQRPRSAEESADGPAPVPEGYDNMRPVPSGDVSDEEIPF